MNIIFFDRVGKNYLIKNKNYVIYIIQNNFRNYYTTEKNVYVTNKSCFSLKLNA